MEIVSSAGKGKSSRFEKMICIDANAAVLLPWLHHNRRSMKREKDLQGETIFFLTKKRNYMILGMRNAAKPPCNLDSLSVRNNNHGFLMGTRVASLLEVRWRMGGRDWSRFHLRKLPRFLLTLWNSPSLNTVTKIRTSDCKFLAIYSLEVFLLSFQMHS